MCAIYPGSRSRTEGWGGAAPGDPSGDNRSQDVARPLAPHGGGWPIPVTAGPPGGPPMAAISADHNLLFGLLTLQNGLIDQGQLVAAFHDWTRDKALTLAEHLAARGDLDPEQRAGVEAMIALHLRKHGGSAAQS